MKKIGAFEAKNRLSELLEAAENGEEVVITKHGRPTVVMLSIDDLESLEETLAILSNPALLEEIREAEADLAAGKTTRLTKDEALAQLKPR